MILGVVQPFPSDNTLRRGQLFRLFKAHDKEKHTSFDAAMRLLFRLRRELPHIHRGRERIFLRNRMQG